MARISKKTEKSSKSSSRKNKDNQGRTLIAKLKEPTWGPWRACRAVAGAAGAASSSRPPGSTHWGPGADTRAGTRSRTGTGRARTRYQRTPAAPCRSLDEDSLLRSLEIYMKCINFVLLMVVFGLFHFVSD